MSTPIQAFLKLSKEDAPKSDAKQVDMAKVPYFSAVVDSLMYAMIAARSDIAFAVGVVSQYMTNPGRKHWEAVKHIIRYLKNTASSCLRFGNSDASIVGYADGLCGCRLCGLC